MRALFNFAVLRSSNHASHLILLLGVSQENYASGFFIYEFKNAWQKKQHLSLLNS